MFSQPLFLSLTSTLSFDAHCMHISQGIFGGGEATASDYSYFDATVGPADESVFQPPAACHRAAALLRAAGAVDESARLRMRSVQNGFVRRKGV
jgi:hypothetical protein